MSASIDCARATHACFVFVAIVKAAHCGRWQTNIGARIIGARTSLSCSWLSSATGEAPAAPWTSLSCSWLPSATGEAPVAPGRRFRARGCLWQPGRRLRRQDVAFVLVVAFGNRGGACGARTSLSCSWLPSATGEAPAAPGRRFRARGCLRQPGRRLRRQDVAFVLVVAFGNRGGACGARTSLSCSWLPSATGEAPAAPGRRFRARGLPSATGEAPAAPGRRFRARGCLRQPGRRLRRQDVAFVLVVAFGNRGGACGARTSLSCSWLPSATGEAPAAPGLSLSCSWLPSATGEAPAAPGRRFGARGCLRQPGSRLRRLDVAFVLVVACGNRGGACGARTALSCSWLPSATGEAPGSRFRARGCGNRGGAWISLSCSWLPSATGEAPAAPGRRFRARGCLRQPGRRLRRLDVAFVLVVAFGNQGGACGALGCQLSGDLDLFFKKFGLRKKYFPKFGIGPCFS